MDFADALRNKVIDHLLRNQAFTPVSQLYVAAHTDVPSLTGGTSNEISGSGYARQPIHFSAASAGTTASDGTTSANGTAVQIPMPTSGGPWLVQWLGIWDALTAGNMYMRVPLLGSNYEAKFNATTDVFDIGQTGQIADGDRVYLFDASGTLPTGLTPSSTSGDAWHVVGTSGSTFQVSDTAGGSAFTSGSADGGLIVRKLAAQTLNANNILQLSNGQVALVI